MESKGPPWALRLRRENRRDGINRVDADRVPEGQENRIQGEANQTE